MYQASQVDSCLLRMLAPCFLRLLRTVLGVKASLHVFRLLHTTVIPYVVGSSMLQSISLQRRSTCAFNLDLPPKGLQLVCTWQP